MIHHAGKTEEMLPEKKATPDEFHRVLEEIEAICQIRNVRATAEDFS
jgi:hypothetical protein